MPRRSSRAKAEPDANAETRVTRRSLRGAQPESPAKVKATPAKESPAKPAARGRGARSTSRRGRTDVEEEEVDEEPTVEPTAESDASEEPEEVVPASPKKGKKSPAPARGRARGRGRSRGRSPRAAGSKADKEDEADKEEDEAAEAVVKDTMSPSRRARKPLQTTPKTTPTRSTRRGRSSVAEAEPEAEAPMEEAAAADDKEDKKRKREDEEEESKAEDAEKAVKKQKVDEAPVEDKPGDASKEEAVTKETEEAMETESAEEVKEDDKMAETKEPIAEAAKVEVKEAAKEKEAPEKEESKTEEEPTKAADEDEPMIEEEATKDEAKTETKKDDAKTETKEDDAKTETKEDDAKTETKEDDADTAAETKEEDSVTKAPEVATKEPEVTTKEPEVVTKEPEAEQEEPAAKEAEAEAAPVEEEMKVDEPETKAEQEAETPSADPPKRKSTEKMEAATYAAPDQAEPSDPKDIIKDYVVVNMEDVPASDSAEVSQCVPAEKPASTEESTTNQREENATTDQTTDKMSTEVASNGSNTHLSNSTPADTQHHNDNAISNGSDTESSADPLFSRKFIANPNLAAGVDQSKKFTLVSYNILADCHIKQEKYPWMDKGSLPMEARSKRFIQELKYLDADIICLQEVGPDYYNDTLVPTLKASGYEGVFKKRTDEHFNEGEATFFRLSQFSLVSHRGLALKDVAFKELEACGLDSDKAVAVKAFVDRPAVVLITQLKSNSSGTLLTVGNIHVSYEPITNLDLQCIQAACAVKEVVSMSESPNNAHVICGDFNARPETVLYQLTKEGYLNDTSTTALQAMQNVTMKDDTKQALVNLWWKGFQHTSSSLRSCYSTVNGSEPMTARDHTGACKNIDYIWCGGANLDVAGVAAISPETLITAGIPNATFPSDHLSLKAELFFK